MTPGALGRILHDHGDAVYDFALAVTDSPKAAAEVVRKAVPAAIGEHGADPTRAALLNSVLAAAVHRRPGGAPLAGELLEPGGGSGHQLQHVGREAARALPTHTRGILDLLLRQGLEGESLAAALGVAPGQVSAATKTALEAADHLVGSVLLVRLARADCPGLARLISEWPPDAGADRLADDVSAHQSSCTACGDRRRVLVPVTSLLASVPPTPAPPELMRSGRLPGGPASRPRSRFRRRLRPLLAAGAVTGAAVMVASAVMLTRGGEERPGRASAGGRLEVPGEGLDLEPGATTAIVELANTGVETLEFSAVSESLWLRAEPVAGTVPPGERLELAVVVDRERAPEGAVGEVRVRSSGGTTIVPVRPAIERPPVLSGLVATPEATVREGCPGAGPIMVRVSVVEESGIDRVELYHRGRRGGEQVNGMARDGASWTGAFGPFDRSGTVRWWVRAVDIRGNAASSSPAVVTVSAC